jgi:S-disulfanyl-L-cysteine oxidoreductase SoxD
MGTAIQPVVRIGRYTIAAAIIALGTMAFSADAVSAQQGKADDGASILHGAYTAAQAARGQTVFSNTCGNCHSTSEFSGAPFQRKWANQPVFTFFDHVRSSMPLDNPGGLSRAEYAAVLAYILRLNAYPEGAAELPTEDAKLRAIRFEVKPAGNR